MTYRQTVEAELQGFIPHDLPRYYILDGCAEAVNSLSTTLHLEISLQLIFKHVHKLAV